MRRNPGLLRMFHLPESAPATLPGYEILYHLQFCLFFSSLGHRPRQSAFRAVTRQNRFHAVLLLLSSQNSDGSKISPTEVGQMRILAIRYVMTDRRLAVLYAVTNRRLTVLYAMVDRRLAILYAVTDRRLMIHCINPAIPL